MNLNFLNFLIHHILKKNRCALVCSGAQWCTVVDSGAQECTKCTSFLTLSVKLESWNLVWILELKFHKLSYQPYFEKNRRAAVHRSAQECTKCTFSLTFLSAKLESWNLVRMLELKFHQLSYQPYFEKTGVQWCTRVHKVHIFLNFVC